MWTLNRQGDLDYKDATDIFPANANVVTLHPSDWDANRLETSQDADYVIITFSSPADGRGFSMAKQISIASKQSENRPVLIATGALTPDHARMAFQSGFDEIHLAHELLARQTKKAWDSSLTLSVDATYVERAVSSDKRAIWSRRHSV